MKKLGKILSLVSAKVLFVFGWIYDFSMRILNAVNKTPIEDDERRNVRVNQFAIASLIFYALCNSAINFLIKTLYRASGGDGFIACHFMIWDIIIPRSFAVFILEIILSLIVGLAVAIKLHTFYRMKTDAKDVKGDSKFMTSDELEKNFFAVEKEDIDDYEQRHLTQIESLTAAGLIVGETKDKYYIEPDTYNSLIVGATRSGKGECFVLPSLRLMAMANQKSKPHIIVNDMKGELLEKTYHHFVRNGYNVMVLDLIDVSHSMHWNPLQEIINEYLKARHAGSDDLSQVSSLVSSFAHCLTDDSKSEAVWTNSAHSLLCALVYYFLDRGYEKGDMSEVNMPNIYSFYSEFGTYDTYVEDNGVTKSVNALDEVFTRLPAGTLAKLAYTTSNFSKEETRSSIRTVLSSDLNIFATDTGVQKLTAANDINYADFCRSDKPSILFMVIPYEEKSRHVIASMFIDQCFLYLAQQARLQPNGCFERKVEFMIDEFGQLPIIPEMGTKLNVSAGANILFNLFLQDLNQLKRYKDEADSVRAGCNLQVYINSLNPKTNKEFSSEIGNETVNYLTFSGNIHGFLDSQRETVDRKALLDENQLSRLEIGEAIILKQRCSPVRTKITPYHLLPYIPSRIPRLEIPIETTDIRLSDVIYPLDDVWDSLGEIGMRYRMDALQTRANGLFDKLYRIEKQIASITGQIPDDLIKQRDDCKTEAKKAQKEADDYKAEIDRINEFRSSNMIMSGIGSDESGYYDYDSYSEGADLSSDAIYKLNELDGYRFDEELSKGVDYAKAYVKKMQASPSLRSEFSKADWIEIEEVLKNGIYK